MTFEEAIKIGKTRQECLRAQNDGRCKCNLIPNYCIKGCEYNTSDKEYDEFETLAIKALEQQLRDDIVSKEKTDWTPVSEGLPKLYEEVIVTDIETSDTYVSRYVGNEYWECDNGLYQNRIIAWQPKPKPYKVESEVCE